MFPFGHALGLRKPAQIVVNAAGYGPLVTGWRHPVIVLPECLVYPEPTSDVELALAHELVHVRRGDTLTSGLQAVVRCVWWFHPIIWWMNRLLDRACELCCDEEVIATLRCEPASYARCLVSIVERRHALRHVIALPGTRPVEITASRIARLGRPPGNFLPRTPWYYWLLFFIGAVVLIPARPLRSFSQQVNIPEEAPALITGQEATEALEADPAAAGVSGGRMD